MSDSKAHPLVMFRTRPNRYRFHTHQYFWFGLFAGIAGLVSIALVIAWPDADVSGRLVGVGGVLAPTLVAVRFVPTWRWLEIEESACTWTFRHHFGWSTSTVELPKDRIAMATVEEDGRADSTWPAYQHVKVFQKDDTPFSRGDIPPIELARSFGLPVPVLVEICRLIAPGYARETYLLPVQ